MRRVQGKLWLRALCECRRCAMGQCYENEQLGMTQGAIRCYQRAAENGDREGEASAHK